MNRSQASSSRLVPLTVITLAYTVCCRWGYDPLPTDLAALSAGAAPLAAGTNAGARAGSTSQLARGGVDAGAGAPDLGGGAGGSGAGGTSVVTCNGPHEVLSLDERSCYRFDPEDLQNFGAARAACQAWEGDLADVDDSVENEMITQLVSPHLAWIGYSRRISVGVWRWVSGDASAYTNWAPNEPNNTDGDEECVLYVADPVSGAFQGFWDDRECAWLATYVCEKQR